MTSANDK